MVEKAKWQAELLRQAADELDKKSMAYFPSENFHVVADTLEELAQQLEAERDELLQKNQQLERERDAAVEMAMFLAGTNFAFPCESDELACSEYCEKHCNFSTSQKECWLEYFRRCGAPKEVKHD